ncbi:hypothetical protein [Cupriavidus gilardii]|uniref:Uncharacterized protein n=1 Tax=Cupriavidus gilardii TaxID=82541 RepID=A0A849BGN6_9BURK|nr:hypothetical protein [Cupriavidus gilardii]QQE07103.1 hypothetical protein IC580_01035 [Cupriavidus sp. ISTL7]MCT9051780.1 hypothetical protein [Cupriavidus gilardii]NNH12785.1 hypothetical protein [Cupriavidus gilardii]USE79887.1 hypothetical protein NDR89_25340 [Cupriavidus gilardii]WNG70180.1 hypothetical protein QWJ31_24485 [Cupriavidus gilardii]
MTAVTRPTAVLKIVSNAGAERFGPVAALDARVDRCVRRWRSTHALDA